MVALNSCVKKHSKILADLQLNIFKINAFNMFRHVRLTDLLGVEQRTTGHLGPKIIIWD